jgi:hypothetical protein
MLNIESKMEAFARTYAKDTGIQIKMGNAFCTDGKTIYIVPVTDQHDPWIRFMTEVITYHETGHIITGDAPTHKNIKDASKRHIFNVVRDVVVEHVMETEYVGLKDKWIEFFEGYFKRNNYNDRPELRQLIGLIYIRGREQLLGKTFDIKVAPAVQEIFDKVLAQFVTPVCEHTDIATSLKLTEDIYEALKQVPEPKPQPKGKGKSKPQQSGEQQDEQSEPGEDDGSGSGDEQQDGEPGSDGEDDSTSEPSEGDEDGNGSGNSDDESDPDSDAVPEDSDGSSEDGNTGENDQDESGSSSSSKGEGDPDGEDSSEGSASDDQTAEGNPGGDGSDGDSDDAELSDEAKKELEKLQEELKDGEESKTLTEEAVEEINKYAVTNLVYRTEQGLQEIYTRQDPRGGWESEVNGYEAYGRKMVGFLGGKLKNLFISERAPIVVRNTRSGRLDVRNLYKVRTGALDVYYRKEQGRYEDACVYEVIDNSGSMEENGNAKANIAQGILTCVSSDLDRLRIPFGAVGFTSDSDYSTDGVRRVPCQLNIIKDFEEPYRTVRHRFVWPTDTSGTVELPGIQHAAYQLAQRRETKKVLFILTDGGTASGTTELNSALRVATKEFIERLVNCGVKVVGIGVIDSHIRDYCPDFIHVRDLNTFASDFYNKLTKLLL